MMYKEQIKAEIKELERKNRRYELMDDGANESLPLAIKHNKRLIASLKKLYPKAKHIKYADKFAALLKQGATKWD